MSKATPMLTQYLEIKEQYKDCILFFRVGDFYEMFFEDAIEASQALDITLTKKRLSQDIDPAPLCGVPYHASDSYLARLLSAGYKVAVCDQVEDPATTKGLVKREVTRVITPGTMTGDLMLTPSESNYLVSAYYTKHAVGLAYTDISTGELEALTIEADTERSLCLSLMNELARIDANEIIIAGDAGDGCGLPEHLVENISSELNTYISVRPNDDFIPDDEANFSEEFETHIKYALTGLFNYLRATQKRNMDDISDLCLHRISDRMLLDKTVIRNLELTETMYEKEVKGSLLGVLDRTKTAMGARLLKKWIKEPLINKSQIDARLDAVESLLEEVLVRNNVRESLKHVYDIERLSGRLASGNANGRDLQALKASLEVIPDIKSQLCDAADWECASSLLVDLNSEIHNLDHICKLIDDALLEEQPFTVKDGVMIKPGYSKELDDLKNGISGGQQWIAELENVERERTGIKTLKVRFNRVQGYYIEVRNTNVDLVPDDYVRKQTLANAERYITPELKKIENTVLSAEAKINLLEYDIFCELRDKIYSNITQIKQTAVSLAKIDVLQSLAETAEKMRYNKPSVYDDDEIMIVRGRHPVIEYNLSGGSFVPNDIKLDLKDDSTLLITGPNMAGKSTFMRQTALIVLMAQMGSFVPADTARIGICDRIFTRIGASDNIAKEQSTFFVEMNELSYIISEYTNRSLIILDEIGRGTSTYDGLAIAWAILDYLCAENQRARCLFATHYHELTSLDGHLTGLRNLSTKISENDGDVVYLHKIVYGSSSRSYGIHVAKLAGLPNSLLDDAEDKLEILEEGRSEMDKHVKADVPYAQLSLFVEDNQQANKKQKAPVEASTKSTQKSTTIKKIVDKVNVLELTPSKAIALIEEIKEIYKDEE